jgi:hypothetical protein
LARLENVLYIGGNFRGIAPGPNASGSVLVVDPVSGLPIPGFPGFSGLTNAIDPDDEAAGIWASTSSALSMAQCRCASGWLTCWPTATSIRPGRRSRGRLVRALKLVTGVGLFVGGDFSS